MPKIFISHSNRAPLAAEFSKRLQQLMAERELTQSDVAALIWKRSLNARGAWVANGRDRLSVWVSGKSFPDPENLAKLAKALKVSVQDLAPAAVLQPAAEDWAMTKRGDGKVRVQIDQYVPAAIAHEIHGLLLRADQEDRGEGANASPWEANPDVKARKR